MRVYTRNQVMYSLDVSSGDDVFCKSHPAMRYVAQKVSKVVGGCTLIDTYGYWADVDKADKDDYTNYSLGCENGVQLQVKAEVDKQEKIEETIVKAFVEAADKYEDLELNWVCGHQVLSDGTTVSFNFSIEENK